MRVSGRVSSPSHSLSSPLSSLPPLTYLNPSIWVHTHPLHLQLFPSQSLPPLYYPSLCLSQLSCLSQLFCLSPIVSPHQPLAHFSLLPTPIKLSFVSGLESWDRGRSRGRGKGSRVIDSDRQGRLQWGLSYRRRWTKVGNIQGVRESEERQIR